MNLIEKPLMVKGIPLDRNIKISYREASERLGLGLGPDIFDAELVFQKRRYEVKDQFGNTALPRLVGDQLMGDSSFRNSTARPLGFEDAYRNLSWLMSSIDYFRGSLASGNAIERQRTLEWCLEKTFGPSGTSDKFIEETYAQAVFEIGDSTYSFPNGKSVTEILKEFTQEGNDLCRSVCDEHWPEIYAREPQFFEGEPYALLVSTAWRHTRFAVAPIFIGFAEKVPSLGIFDWDYAREPGIYSLVGVWLVNENAYNLFNSANREASRREFPKLVNELPFGLETIRTGTTAMGLVEPLPKGVDIRAFSETFLTLLGDSEASPREAFEIAAALEA